MKTLDDVAVGRRCVICGRYFCPDQRVGARQKTCGLLCGRRLKIRRDRLWRQKNPDYFLADSRNGVERPVRKRGGVLQVEIGPAKHVELASADIGVRFLMSGEGLQVQIPRGIPVIRASTGTGAVLSGG